MSLQTPILFLVFNRPELTARVFEAIRLVKPARLYVAADGPRADRVGECERVEQVRQIVHDIDWPCELKTLFRSDNLGCKRAVEGGITWFFEHESRGIILEDDCLPHPDFFSYCERCLDQFEDDLNVWHINGNNFGAPKVLYQGYTIGFTSLAQAWGWATWANRWNAGERNLFYLAEQARASKAHWMLSSVAKSTKYSHLLALIEGLDTWDYQWQIAILNAGGYVVSPSSNLISNLGDGEDATHTTSDPDRIRLPVEPLSDWNAPSPHPNDGLNRWYGHKMGLHRWRRFVSLQVRKTTHWAHSGIKCALRGLFFSSVTPIVIASSGRAGSSLLTTAVAKSLVAHRFRGWPPWIQELLVGISTDYLNRLAALDDSNAVVLKTHDLYSRNMHRPVKYLFIYGDPLEAAQSVARMGKIEGELWVEHHIYHLVGRGSSVDVLRQDVLNYERQLSSWGHAAEVFKLHYDDLWAHATFLSEFLGFELRLPLRQARTAKNTDAPYDDALFKRLRACEAWLRISAGDRPPPGHISGSIDAPAPSI